MNARLNKIKKIVFFHPHFVTSLLNYNSHAVSHLMCFAPLCLTCITYLRALCVFVSLRLVCLIYASYQRGLPILLVYTTKHYEPYCFYACQKIAVALFKQGNLLSIFKTWTQFNSFVFFFSSLQPWSNKFFSLI